MLIKSEYELKKIKEASSVAAITLRELLDAAKPGITTLDLDVLGQNILKDFKAESAPKYFYKFPASICICVGNEVAHGLPSERIIKEDDLVNIDVSVVLDGFVADNGASVYFGNDKRIKRLCKVSKDAMYRAIDALKAGLLVNEVGRIVEYEAKKNNFTVIKNLCGHGVGRKIHEEPAEIPNYHDVYNKKRFRENSVIALETFVSTKSEQANEKGDKWTLVCEKGEFVAQYEHTILVTKGGFEILTHENGI